MLSGIVIPPALVKVLLDCDVGKLTVWVRLPLLVAKDAVPLYVAWIVCRLSVSVFAGAVQVATPLSLTAMLLHRVEPVVLSTNVTVPVLTVLELVVVEVKVTAWFVFDGFSEELIVVVVGAAATAVVMSSDQPPAMVAPVPLEAVSSWIHRVHVPLTLAPLNPPKTEVKVAEPAVAGVE